METTQRETTIKEMIRKGEKIFILLAREKLDERLASTERAYLANNNSCNNQEKF